MLGFFPCPLRWKPSAAGASFFATKLLFVPRVFLSRVLLPVVLLILTKPSISRLLIVWTIGLLQDCNNSNNDNSTYNDSPSFRKTETQTQSAGTDHVCIVIWFYTPDCIIIACTWLHNFIASTGSVHTQPGPPRFLKRPVEKASQVSQTARQPIPDYISGSNEIWLCYDHITHCTSTECEMFHVKLVECSSGIF